MELDSKSRTQSLFGWIRRILKRDTQHPDSPAETMSALFASDRDRGDSVFTMLEVQRAFARENLPQSEWEAALDSINRTGQFTMPDGSILRLRRVGAGVARERSCSYSTESSTAQLSTPPVMTSGGAVLFDADLPEELPRAIYADGSKAWLAVAEAGLFECDASNGRCVQLEPGQPGFTAIAGRGDALWVGRPGRIGHWNRIRKEWGWYELVGVEITALLCADDCVWFGTHDSLGKLDPATGEFQLIDSPLSPTSSLCVIEDAIWGATWDWDGRPAAFDFQRQTWVTPRSNAAPLCILEAPLTNDESSRAWVGTLLGIKVFRADTFEYLGDLGALHGQVYVMLQLAHYVLFGTNDGLWAIDIVESAEQDQVLPVRVKWPGQTVYTISGTDRGWCVVREPGHEWRVEICSLDDLRIAEAQCA